jgi:hypothetical protein
VIKVCVTMPASIGDGVEFLADVRALDAAGADMVRIEGDGTERWILLGAIAGATTRLKMWASTSEPPAIVQTLARGRVVMEQPADEAWVSIPLPPSRDSWVATLRAHEDAGATGIIVPWDPRLIDLLRNPEPEDRSDLLISTG